MKTIYLGDSGTLLILDTCVNITSATQQVISVEKPDGSTFDLASQIYDKTKVKGVMVPGDFDQEGKYNLQAKITMPSWSGLGDTVPIKVKAVFT